MKKLWFLCGLWVACLWPVDAAHADEIAWRATSIQGPRQPGLNTRLGVAVFANGETATTVRQVRPAAPPEGGRLDILVEAEYRFGDGSTLRMDSRETIALTPPMTHAPGEWRGEGRIVSGSGRYAGASGSFRFRAVMGLDAAADGMLGDAFLEGQGSLSLSPR
jgi:hypothetical protein